jgi:hypothetical protein
MNRNELIMIFFNISKKIDDIAKDIQNIIERLMDVMEEINKYNTGLLTKLEDIDE